MEVPRPETGQSRQEIEGHVVLWALQSAGCCGMTSFSSKFPSPAHWDKASSGRPNSRWLDIADTRVKYTGAGPKRAKLRSLCSACRSFEVMHQRLQCYERVFAIVHAGLRACMVFITFECLS